MDRTLWNRGKGLTRHDVELCRLDVEKAVISATLARVPSMHRTEAGRNKTEPFCGIE